MLAAILLSCGTLLISCSNEDNGTTEPTEQQLQDGEWTGSGEGRGGSIIAKIVVKNHEVEQVVIVSQSESVYLHRKPSIESLQVPWVGLT